MTVTSAVSRPKPPALSINHSLPLSQLRAGDRVSHPRILQGVTGGVVVFTAQGSSDPYLIGERNDSCRQLETKACHEKLRRERFSDRSQMDYSSEESDISDSEINEYIEKPYEELRAGKHKVRVSSTSRCPFCAGKKKQVYNYELLLQHALGVGKVSANRSAKQKAIHLAVKANVVQDLASKIDMKNDTLNELEYKYYEKTMSLSRMLEEKDKLHYAFVEETRKMQCLARDNVRRILEEQEKLSCELEAKKKKIDQWSKQLNKLEKSTEGERQKLDEERKKNDLRNNSLQLASMDQKKADENFIGLIEEQKLCCSMMSFG